MNLGKNFYSLYQHPFHNAISSSTPKLGHELDMDVWFRIQGWLTVKFEVHDEIKNLTKRII